MDSARQGLRGLRGWVGDRERGWRSIAGVALLCFGMLPGFAAAQAGRRLDLTAFQQQIGAATTLVTACAASPGNCDPNKVPADGQVAADGGRPAFAVDWEWLRQMLQAAHGAKPEDRAKAMVAAGAHLQQQLTETQMAAPGQAERREVTQAEIAAEAILAQPEFREADTPPSWWARMLARVQDWIFALLNGVGRVGGHHPWLAPLIEWGCFALAAGGLLFFVRRSLQRQSLRIAFGTTAPQTGGRDRDVAAWIELAEARAAAGDWREGVHCLYWAAIASLEARRAWRPNPTRTPREYLRLLRPGSEPQRLLRELTRALERLWYGHGEATEAEFRAARSAYEALAAVSLRPETQAGGDRGGLHAASGVA